MNRGIDMIKFIHTADIHLGTNFKDSYFGGEIGNIRRKELWETFEKLINQVKKQSIDLLLIAGDLFENDTFTFKDFFRLTGNLESIPSTKVIIISGNHDKFHSNSFYLTEQWPDNVTILGKSGLDSIYFRDLNLNVIGYSWDNYSRKESSIINQIEIKKDSSNILVLHGDDTSAYMNFEFQKLKDLNLDYVAFGHIHKPKFIYENMAYCGSLEPLDITETGDRGYIEGIIGEENTFKFIPFSKRRYLSYKISINEDMNYQDVVNSIINNVSHSNLDFLMLEINGIKAREFDIDTLKEYLKREYFYVDVVDNSIEDFDLESLRESYKDTLIQYYIDSFNDDELIDPINKKALYIGLSALLQGAE